MMRLRADIAKTQNGVCSQLPLDGKEVILVVRICVRTLWRSHPGLRQEGREVDIRVGMLDRRVQRRKSEWKRIDVCFTARRANERCGEKRRRRAGVTQA